MNSQRWITLGAFILVAVCLLSAGLWIPLLPFGDDDEEVAETDMTATMEAGGLLPELEITATPTFPNIEQVISGEASIAEMDSVEGEEIDPVIAELLAALNKEELGIGEDPFIIKVGTFIVLDTMRQGEGTASIYQLGESQWVLRLDPFSVTQGADLHVLLSQNRDPRTSADALLPKYVDLGVLMSASGAQNYPIPADVMLSQYQSVVIYSISLNIIYTTAPLEDVRGQS